MVKPTSPVWTPGAIGTEGCRGYWLLHEGSGTTVSDISPGGNHGVFVGEPAWGTGAFGPNLSGFGASAYVAADGAGVAAGASGGYPCWCAVLASCSVATQGIVLSLGNATSGIPLVALGWNTSFFSPAAGGLNYLIRGDSVDTFAGANWASGGLATDGQPHVLMGVSESASVHRLYVDGVLRASSTAVLVPWPTALPWGRLSLGVRRRSSVDQPFPGSLHAAAFGWDAVPDPADLAADWLSGTFSAARGGAAPELVLPGPLILDGPLPPGEHVFSW